MRLLALFTLLVDAIIFGPVAVYAQQSVSRPTRTIIVDTTDKRSADGSSMIPNVPSVITNTMHETWCSDLFSMTPTQSTSTDSIDTISFFFSGFQNDNALSAQSKTIVLRGGLPMLQVDRLGQPMLSASMQELLDLSLLDTDIVFIVRSESGEEVAMPMSHSITSHIWNGFQDEIIRMYGEETWRTVLTNAGYISLGAGLAVTYAALHATPAGWIADLVLLSLLGFWVATNAWTFTVLAWSGDYRSMGKHLAQQVNALVMGGGGFACARAAITKIPKLGAFIEQLRIAINNRYTTANETLTTAELRSMYESPAIEPRRWVDRGPESHTHGYSFDSSPGRGGLTVKPSSRQGVALLPAQNRALSMVSQKQQPDSLMAASASVVPELWLRPIAAQPDPLPEPDEIRELTRQKEKFEKLVRRYIKEKGLTPFTILLLYAGNPPAREIWEKFIEQDDELEILAAIKFWLRDRGLPIAEQHRDYIKRKVAGLYQKLLLAFPSLGEVLTERRLLALLTKCAKEYFQVNKSLAALDREASELGLLQPSLFHVDESSTAQTMLPHRLMVQEAKKLADARSFATEVHDNTLTLSGEKNPLFVSLSSFLRSFGIDHWYYDPQVDVVRGERGDLTEVATPALYNPLDRSIRLSSEAFVGLLRVSSEPERLRYLTLSWMQMFLEFTAEQGAASHLFCFYQQPVAASVSTGIVSSESITNPSAEPYELVAHMLYLLTLLETQRLQPSRANDPERVAAIENESRWLRPKLVDMRRFIDLVKDQLLPRQSRNDNIRHEVQVRSPARREAYPEVVFRSVDRPLDVIFSVRPTAAWGFRVRAKLASQDHPEWSFEIDLPVGEVEALLEEFIVIYDFMHRTQFVDEQQHRVHMDQWRASIRQRNSHFRHVDEPSTTRAALQYAQHERLPMIIEYLFSAIVSQIADLRMLTSSNIVWQMQRLENVASDFNPDDPIPLSIEAGGLRQLLLTALQVLPLAVRYERDIMHVGWFGEEAALEAHDLLGQLLIRPGEEGRLVDDESLDSLILLQQRVDQNPEMVGMIQRTLARFSPSPALASTLGDPANPIDDVVIISHPHKPNDALGFAKQSFPLKDVPIVTLLAPDAPMPASHWITESRLIQYSSDGQMRGFTVASRSYHLFGEFDYLNTTIHSALRNHMQAIPSDRVIPRFYVYLRYMGGVENVDALVDFHEQADPDPATAPDIESLVPLLNPRFDTDLLTTGSGIIASTVNLHSSEYGEGVEYWIRFGLQRDEQFFLIFIR